MKINPKELLFKLNQEIDDIEQLVVSVKMKSNGLNHVYYSTVSSSELHFHGAFISKVDMENAINSIDESEG